MSRAVLLNITVVLALIVACVAALLVVSIKPAKATFPGRNGDLAFIRAEQTFQEEDGDGYLEQVFRMRPDGTNVRNISNIVPDASGSFVQHPVWSPDGTKIAWDNDECIDNSDGPCKLISVATADGGGIYRSERGDWGMNPTWSPSGRQIVYEGTDSNLFHTHLATIFLDKAGHVIGTPMQLTPYREAGFGLEREVDVSPDGEKIAFSSNRDGDFEIYVIDADTPEDPDNPPVHLTDNATYRDVGPDWSPSGSKIVYTSCRNGNCDVFTMNADGSGKKNLTRTSTVGEENALWSPSGPRILYHANGDIFVMNADGSRKKNLTRTSTVSEWDALWSPDGNMIAFVSNQDGDQEIWKMGADGSRKKDLTNNTVQDYQPDWQPRR